VYWLVLLFGGSFSSIHVPTKELVELQKSVISFFPGDLGLVSCYVNSDR